ncbi:MAG: hypothetical protein M1831_005837 [Alyxoria varia]|nr:MAG: hypothetical protein M1831_005837 [Alyxoria varia]
MTNVSDATAIEILESSSLYALAPENPKLDLHTLLSHVAVDELKSPSSDGRGGPFAAVPQRGSLFLDERVTVFVLLSCPFMSALARAGQDGFERFIARVKVLLEAYAVGKGKPTTQASGGGGGHGEITRTSKEYTGQRTSSQQQPLGVKDLVDSQAIEDSVDPVITVAQGPKTADDKGDEEREDTGDDRNGRRIYVLWKVDVHLARTRIHSTNPSLYFSCSASLRQTSTDPLPGNPQDPYLPSLTPESTNLFESLSSDPSFKGAPPILTAARLTKHAPAGGVAKELGRPLRNAHRTLMRIVPGVVGRVKCARVGGGSGVASVSKVLAYVEVETSPYIGTGVLRLDNLNLKLSGGGQAKLVTADTADGEPRADARLESRQCKAREKVSFVYDLVAGPTTGSSARNRAERPQSVEASGSTHNHALSLHVEASVLPLSINNPNSDNDSGSDSGSDEGSERDQKAQDPHNLHPRHITTQTRSTIDLLDLQRRHQPTPGLTNATNTTAGPPFQPFDHPLTLTISTVGPPLVRMPPLHLSNSARNAQFTLSILALSNSIDKTVRIAVEPLLRPSTGREEVGKDGKTVSVVPMTPRVLLRSSGDMHEDGIPPGGCATAEVEYLVRATSSATSGSYPDGGAGSVKALILPPLKIIDLDSRKGEKYCVVGVVREDVMPDVLVEFIEDSDDSPEANEE